MIAATAVGALVLALGVGVWSAALLVATAVALWAMRRRAPARRPRARKRRVWTDEERRFILDRDGWRCVNCGADDQLEIDHVIPFSRGGACSVENACVLCRSCNARKGAS